MYVYLQMTEISRYYVLIGRLGQSFKFFQYFKHKESPLPELIELKMNQP